ncbi:MAG: hypothetical protein U0704_06115 [Candidatus Eisenbacteria bacterium]
MRRTTIPPYRRSLALVCFAAAAAIALSGARPDPERAATLRRWADEYAVQGDVESRDRARRMLEEAIALDPGSAANWRSLGRLHELQNFDQRARGDWKRATELAPADFDSWMGLAAVEKREYLWDLDSTRFAESVDALEHAAALRPYGSRAWLALVPLRYEARDLAGAAIAARRAAAGRPRLPEASLAAAYTAYRLGDFAYADSAFREGLARLAPDRRALFESPSRLPEMAQPDSEWRALDAATRPIAAFRAMRAYDPDPTTRENEAQLEWWSRVTHALLLFDDPLHPELDARAETYMRYGPPQGVLLNPAGVPLYFNPARDYSGPGADRNRSSVGFPLRAQLWLYPELGMRVLLHDRSLRGRWTQPFQRSPEYTNRPDPAVLAARRDLLALGDGWLVLPTRRPASQRLEVSGAFTRFEGERGPRVRAQLDVSAGAADTLVADWVVLDARGRTIERGTTKPGLSGCDPAARRIVEFTMGLAPGTYDVTISAHDPRGRRGFVRRSLDVEPSRPGLAMSDLLVNCGNATTLSAGGVVRLEEAPGHRFRAGAPIAVYAEIYRLEADEQHRTRFEYEYFVRRLDRDGVPGARLAWASRADSVVASASERVRRQFVAVDTAKLEPGTYRVEIVVRDLVTGADVTRTADFTLE